LPEQTHINFYLPEQGERQRTLVQDSLFVLTLVLILIFAAFARPALSLPNMLVIGGVMEIARYGVFGTPAVVVDGEVKSVGKVPTKDEIKA
jgi:hypothetical protein